MWKTRVFSTPLREYPLLQGSRCVSCQFRNATVQLGPYYHLRQYASKPTNGNRSAGSAPGTQKPVQSNQNPTPAPRVPEKKGDEESIAPRLLDRPIGTVIPPLEGQNTGIDSRSLGQRRDDFVDYEKHIARRKELTRQVAKPYFREWSNLRYNSGKTFIANPRLFKSDKALYFPNMYGVTLSSPKEAKSTMSTLRGKISVVNLFSSAWAESQVATFTGRDKNPGLEEAIRSGGGLAQRVDINLEENSFRAWLVRMFMWRMRRNLRPEQHPRYFLVRKGVTDGLKEAIGMMNSKVGYVYLLDEECRIRWAGSGPAESEELVALNNGLRKLIEEQRAIETPEDVVKREKRRVIMSS